MNWNGPTYSDTGVPYEMDKCDHCRKRIEHAVSTRKEGELRFCNQDCQRNFYKTERP